MPPSNTAARQSLSDPCDVRFVAKRRVVGLFHRRLAPNRAASTPSAVRMGHLRESERRAKPPAEGRGRQCRDDAPGDVRHSRGDLALLAQAYGLVAERREGRQRSAEPDPDQGNRPFRCARGNQPEQERAGDIDRPGAPGERRTVQTLHCQVGQVASGRAQGAAEDHEEQGHRLITCSVRRSPATTATRPAASVPARYAPAVTGCPVASRTRPSTAYVANVVKPPRMPVPKNGRTRCRSGHRSTTRTMSAAIRKQPVTVDRKGAHGKPAPWWAIARATASRARAPKAPPAATAQTMSMWIRGG